eukprot:scaffold109316_cov56-Phaeocystis_antarctica.AAC.4
MAPKARRMAFDGHPADGAPYGRTAHFSCALLSTTSPSPPHLTMHCTADHTASSGSRGWRLGFGIRAGRRRTRAYPRPRARP